MRLAYLRNLPATNEIVWLLTGKLGAHMTNVTVLCGRGRQRRWTTTEKLRLVDESLAAGLSVAELARRHDVHPNLLQ